MRVNVGEFDIIWHFRQQRKTLKLRLLCSNLQTQEDAEQEQALNSLQRECHILLCA